MKIQRRLAGGRNVVPMIALYERSLDRACGVLAKMVQLGIQDRVAKSADPCGARVGCQRGGAVAGRAGWDDELMNPTEASADMERAMRRTGELFKAKASDIAKLRGDTTKVASGGYVSPMSQPITGRMFLHDHDGRTCEVAGGVHFPVLTAAEVRAIC